MRLIVHGSAKDDIKKILAYDINAAGKLLAILDEIRASPDLVDRMNVRDCTFEVGRSGKANARGFASQRPRRDLWRLKTWNSENELIPYRVLYGFLPAQPVRPIPTILVLAVVHRETYDYERDHPVTQRVIRDYDDECN